MIHELGIGIAMSIFGLALNTFRKRALHNILPPLHDGSVAIGPNWYYQAHLTATRIGDLFSSYILIHCTEVRHDEYCALTMSSKSF